MTTITINENLPLKRLTYGSLAELLESLEEQHLFVFLRELPGRLCSRTMKEKAKQALRQYRENPDSFADI